MKLVDANVLLYAVNSSVDKHEQARSWLDEALTGNEPVGFAGVVVLAFVRLSTRVGIFPSPLTTGDAVAHVEEWLAQPSAVHVEPTVQHLSVLRSLLDMTGSGGNLVTDAHLAALALEHDASVVTYDNDFDRFRGVRSARPS